MENDGTNTHSFVNSLKFTSTQLQETYIIKIKPVSNS
jgi:hypothetical protein